MATLLLLLLLSLLLLEAQEQVVSNGTVIMSKRPKPNALAPQGTRHHDHGAHSRAQSTQGILYALGGSSPAKLLERIGELNTALKCLARAKVRLPIAIDLYPGSAADAAHIVSSGLHMTVRLESDLLNTSLRQTGTIHKAVAAAHSPFEKTIVMDTDTCVMHDSLQEMLAPLDDDFDFVSA